MKGHTNGQDSLAKVMGSEEALRLQGAVAGSSGDAAVAVLAEHLLHAVLESQLCIELRRKLNCHSAWDLRLDSHDADSPLRHQGERELTEAEQEAVAAAAARVTEPEPEVESAPKSEPALTPARG